MGRGSRSSVCLLTPNMQNRRIIDRAFAAANVQPVPRIETNSVVNLYANVRHTNLAAIMPEYFFTALGPMPNVRAVPLRNPMVEHAVGLVAASREPMPPLIAALMAASEQFSATLAAEGGAAERHMPDQ
jgi:DNA-binding transcriptional LysR family regulator